MGEKILACETPSRPCRGTDATTASWSATRLDSRHGAAAPLGRIGVLLLLVNVIGTGDKCAGHVATGHRPPSYATSQLGKPCVDPHQPDLLAALMVFPDEGRWPEGQGAGRPRRSSKTTMRAAAPAPTVADQKDNEEHMPHPATYTSLASRLQQEAACGSRTTRWTSFPIACAASAVWPTPSSSTSID